MREWEGTGPLWKSFLDRTPSISHITNDAIVFPRQMPEGETERTECIEESNYNFNCEIIPSKLEIIKSRVCAHKHLILYTNFNFMPTIKTV